MRKIYPSRDHCAEAADILLRDEPDEDEDDEDEDNGADEDEDEGNDDGYSE